MQKISIDELIDMVDSRYSLVTIISKRARQIIDGQDIMIKTNTMKPVAIAIEEFYAGAYDPIFNLDQQKELESDMNEEQSIETIDNSEEDIQE